MKNKNNTISTIIIALFVIGEILIALQIWQLNVIPSKYMLLLFGAVLLLDLLLAKLMLFNREKKKKWYRVLGYILSVLLLGVLFFAYHGISKIRETMVAITQTTEIGAVMKLYVLEENRASNLKDVLDYSIAVTESVDQENTETTLDVMQKIRIIFKLCDNIYISTVD